MLYNNIIRNEIFVKIKRNGILMFYVIQ